jgi:flagellar biosynthetic protein FliR
VHGAITFSASWVIAVLLLSLRLAAMFLMTPILAAASVPAVFRMLLVLALAAALSLGLPAAAVPAPAVAGGVAGIGALVEAGFTELALGATLGLGVLVAFAAFSMAGQILGIQMGFGLAQVIDPASNASLPIIASAYNQIAILLFFLANGHHALLRGMAFGLERFPLGRPWPVEAAVGPVLEQVMGLFGLGFALAAPVVFCLLMVEVALGILARNLPQMNMILMGIPVKVVVGLVALSLWFGGMGATMDRVYAGIFRTWDGIFAAEPETGPVGPALPISPGGGGGR